jgi:hypothetical protein
LLASASQSGSRRAGQAAVVRAEQAAAGGATEATTRRTLYHYSTNSNIQKIQKSGELLPSLNPKNARYGPGQYLTDIAPEMIGGRTIATTPPGKMALSQLAQRFFARPFVAKVASFIEIDVAGLVVKQVAPNIFLIEQTTALSIVGRIIRFGRTLP